MTVERTHIRPVLTGLERVGSRVVEDRIAGVEGMLALRGGPVRPLPSHAREAAIASLDDLCRVPSRGLLHLREAIARELREETGIAVDPEREILVTGGAMQALGIAFRTLLSPEDRVLAPTPTFFLEGIARLASARLVPLPCREEDNWRWTKDHVNTMPAATVLFVCNPTNPTGYLPSADDLGWALNEAERSGWTVVCDESYHRFVYDGARFTSILALRERSDRFLLVRSLSKSHALAHWRIGYMAGPAPLIDACTTVLEWEMLHGPTTSQHVAAAVLDGPKAWLGELATEYEVNRDRVWEAAETSGWFPSRKPQAGPFLFLNTSGLEARGGPCPQEQLLSCGVPTVPGSHFGAPGYLRLPFGGDEDTVRRLCDILCTFTPA